MIQKTCSTDEGPICPYCGHENNSLGSDCWAEKQGEGQSACDACGAMYKFKVDYTVCYYAFPLEKAR